MQKRQANRAIIADRIMPPLVEARPSVRVTSPAARRTRIADIREVRKVERNRKAVRMTATQKDSHGLRSAWAKPANLPYTMSVTTHQVRWSQTVTDQG
jgi:hypothetical protein